MNDAVPLAGSSSAESVTLHVVHRWQASIVQTIPLSAIISPSLLCGANEIAYVHVLHCSFTNFNVGLLSLFNASGQQPTSLHA